MKRLLLVSVLLLVGCAVDPNTGMNGGQKLGYVMQCMGNGFCPPMPSASYEQQMLYQQQVNQKRMMEQMSQPVQTTCNKMGNTVNCTTY